MKIFLAIFFCLYVNLNASGQAAPGENKREIKEETGVEEISLARDDGSGKPGAAIDLFVTTDVPIHCFVRLNSTETVSVKMNFVAVKADGLKPESNVVTVNYKTNGTQNGINFNASPATIWAAGTYRIDILIDGRRAKSLNFEIKKSLKEIVREKQSPPKSKTPPKAKQKARKI